MSKALSWLSRELGVEIPCPDVSETMEEVRHAVFSAPEVVIFGAGGAGRRLHSFLRRHQVRVAFFLDSSISGEVEGLPVFMPDQAPVSECPVLIASAWFAEIAQGLKNAGHDGSLLYPVPDVLQLQSRIYDDAAGWTCFQIVERRLTDFQRTADLWDDTASRSRFLKLLLYRLSFFRSHVLPPDMLPCPASEYRAAEANEPPCEDQRLSDEARVLVRYQDAHPSYWERGYLEPRLGDIVIDGGAWQGDTAFWYARRIGPDGRVHAFEPGTETRAILTRNVDAAQLSGQVKVEGAALADADGRAGWRDIPEATPCSHLSGTGDDVAVTSIDSYVKRHALDRVDTIKLDVEGADYDALRGAQSVIRHHKPDLAVSVYHSTHHLVDVPLWIRSQGLGYRLRLSHNQLSISETVCLATVRGV